MISKFGCAVVFTLYMLACEVFSLFWMIGGWSTSWGISKGTSILALVAIPFLWYMTVKKRRKSDD